MIYAYFLVAMAALDFALYASFRRRGRTREARMMLVFGIVALAAAAASFYFAQPVA